MSNVRELHNRAMQLAQQAMVARYSGSSEDADRLVRQAYVLEAQAADLVPDEQRSEPTRSILYRSAASLAHQCGELATTQRLAAKGLAGFPSRDIEKELGNLLSQARFELELREQDLELDKEEVQMAMSGSSVGLGIVPYKEFRKRVESFFQLTRKTVQRLFGREFQQGGRIAQAFKLFEPALAAPKEGSFIITLRFSRAQDIQQLSLLGDTAQIIDEVLTGVEMINRSEERRLRDHIKDDNYYYHFVGQAREIAPDGERINAVHFTSHNRQVGLTRFYDDIQLMEASVEQETRTVRPVETVAGKLDYAVDRKRRNIGMTTKEGKHYEVAVHEGLEDLVKSYWGSWVEITGPCDEKRNIELRDIRPVDMSDD